MSINDISSQQPDDPELAASFRKARRMVETAHDELIEIALILDKCHTALKIVAAGIWRSEDKTIYGIVGEQEAVHEVENALKDIKIYIEGKI